MLICAAIAILVFFTAHLVESRYKLLLWLDAIGLAAYSVMGAAKGLRYRLADCRHRHRNADATFGGILRDLLAGEPSVLLRPEIYVTAAMAGAAAFTLLRPRRRGDTGLRRSLGFLVAFSVRGGALRFGWSFPPYRSRPGRRPEDIP